MGSTIIFGKVMKTQDKIPSSSKKTPVPPRRIPNKTLRDREHLTPHEVESVMEAAKKTRSLWLPRLHHDFVVLSSRIKDF